MTRTEMLAMEGLGQRPRGNQFAGWIGDGPAEPRQPDPMTVPVDTSAWVEFLRATGSPEHVAVHRHHGRGPAGGDDRTYDRPGRRSDRPPARRLPAAASTVTPVTPNVRWPCTGSAGTTGDPPFGAGLPDPRGRDPTRRHAVAPRPGIRGARAAHGAAHRACCRRRAPAVKLSC